MSMKPFKKHKVKREMPETSSSRFRDTEEHDLAYYIHDRVALMHQVFSVIKPKELKSLAPECVRHISIDDLQELCTEELLGISSKRLCAIMDGGEPPTDTESSSSSPEQLETISLDSISSDDEILSQPSSKGKKHKHKKRNKSKSKHKHRESKRTEDRSSEERSRASRAGLTVLELLELQARARAIRAQLQQDNARKSSEQLEVTVARASSGDDEVEIKEEAPEVVEISSEDEKPNVQELEDIQSATNKTTEATDNQKTVTKRVNNLVITVPQTKQARKIKLNRNKGIVSNKNTTTTTNTAVPSDAASTSTLKDTPKVPDKSIDVVKPKEDKKEKLKKKLKKKQKKADSDHDEITLQLSDTEKMDLLEDMDRKNYDIVTSSSEDSESSSESDTDEELNRSDNRNKGNNVFEHNSDGVKQQNSLDKEMKVGGNEVTATQEERIDPNQENKSPSKKIEQEISYVEVEGYSATVNKDTEQTGKEQSDVAERVTVTVNKDSTNNTNEDSMECGIDSETINQKTGNMIESTSNKTEISEIHIANIRDSETMETQEVEEGEIANDSKDLSEGEISEHEDSEVMSDLRQEVVCISDEENKTKKEKKDKKKDKKSKKEKKKKSDFREGADQNFYTHAEISGIDSKQTDDNINKEILCIDIGNSKKTSDVITVEEVLPMEKDNAGNGIVFIDDDDQKQISENKTSTEILSIVDTDDAKGDKKETEIVSIGGDEIFELSDDSSCFEVEGVSVLSKEPTAEEIEALSAKIDDTIDFEVTDKDIEEYDRLQEGTEPSWKERYLGSKKVKQVLSTANILNALRKKNKELKKKLAENKELETIKMAETGKLEVNVSETENDFVEGSIDQFNTLEGSTKYVDPVVIDSEKQNGAVSKEMEKDAKQLLKMYKKLLKYNDINRQKDPNKKKKKKHKKSKDKEKDSRSKAPV